MARRLSRAPLPSCLSHAWLTTVPSHVIVTRGDCIQGMRWSHVIVTRGDCIHHMLLSPAVTVSSASDAVAILAKAAHTAGHTLGGFLFCLAMVQTARRQSSLASSPSTTAGVAYMDMHQALHRLSRPGSAATPRFVHRAAQGSLRFTRARSRMPGRSVYRPQR